MKRSIMGALVLLVALLAMAGAAYAHRQIHDYDLTVPRLGGKDVTSTALQKYHYTKGVDHNETIGGGKTQFAAMFRGSSPTLSAQIGPWKGIGSGDRILLSYDEGQNMPGSNYRLGHKSHIYTLVAVQATGSWSPDE